MNVNLPLCQRQTSTAGYTPQPSYCVFILILAKEALSMAGHSYHFLLNSLSDFISCFFMCMKQADDTGFIRIQDIPIFISNY